MRSEISLMARTSFWVRGAWPGNTDHQRPERLPLRKTFRAPSMTRAYSVAIAVSFVGSKLVSWASRGAGTPRSAVDAVMDHSSFFNSRKHKKAAGRLVICPRPSLLATGVDSGHHKT